METNMKCQPQIIAGKELADYLRRRIIVAVTDVGVEVSETTEFYLVNLLTEFNRTESLYKLEESRLEEEPLAIKLANAICGDTATQIRELKALGDRALYVAGIFPENLEKRAIGLKYYVEMGSSAYGLLSDIFIDDSTFSPLYLELAENFHDLAMVIGLASSADEIFNNTDILRIYERYLRTHDPHLKETLEQEGIIVTECPKAA